MALNPTNIHEEAGSYPAPHPRWLRIWCCHELWCRLQTRLGSCVAVWLWCRPAATAPNQTLAWEPPYAAGAALGKKKKEQIYLYGKGFI